MKDSCSPIAAHLMALGVATVWATTFVCSKQLLECYTPMQVMFLRFLIAYLVLWLLRSLPRRSQLLRIVPLAALNSGVLGTVLVERTQTFTLGQSLGFGLGSGIGYVLAVLLVTEARHRLRSKAIPKAFRGLPITLVYIGVLALAIYGFTGHSVIL